VQTNLTHGISTMLARLPGAANYRWASPAQPGEIAAPAFFLTGDQCLGDQWRA
jgi:hypothetical protein